MAEWRFLDRAIILAVHEEQLAQHGGGVGLRDEGLLDSALARPENLAAYNSDADAAALAAAYAFGIAKNHPFIDGNKRTAFVAMELFLMDTGYVLTASDEDALMTMLRLAAGEMGEEEYAGWISERSRRV
ncbi:MAG: type II toxin-antitoxin system death-on-curing family toxin [Hyphomicrobiales bacterium]|nr:type II toxin-antitoxin system death-on-curing family toxin [Mycobacterium sp.]MCC2104873.1 type II toxin-antitoxin system death-on-curing family toxin [Hyphomicrobiales bacterium]MCC2108713.1 type II toxin-antitoxin system death-on-curing family toxin [Hyphomicrobiales bacterium]